MTDTEPTSRWEIEVPPAPPERTFPLVVRAITGEEERRALTTSGIQRALTVLLAQCVHTPGAASPIGTDAARAFSTGERTRLALAVAAVSDDGVFRQQIRCVEPSCRARVDLAVPLADLRDRPAPPAEGTVRLTLPVDRSRPLQGHAILRLPDGADQEAVEAFSAGVRQHGLLAGPTLARLLDRLLIGVSSDAVCSETAMWSEEDRQGAWTAIRGAMGGPETEVDVRCPVCGERFAHRLSPLGWLRGTPREALRRLDTEVERLSKAFGWTAEQVLWLPRPKRREYVACVT